MTTLYHVIYIPPEITPNGMTYDSPASSDSGNCCVYREIGKDQFDAHNDARNLTYVADFDEVNQYLLIHGLTQILPKRTGTFYGPSDLEQKVQAMRMERLCIDTNRINV